VRNATPRQIEPYRWFNACSAGASRHNDNPQLIAQLLGEFYTRSETDSTNKGVISKEL
jgi:hypothetical protein